MSDIVKNDRPESEDGRLEKELRCYDFLDRLKIPYRRIDHEVAMTMEACEEIEQVLECSICKNLMLTNRQETDFYLLLMPGDKVFKTKQLSAQIHTARLSFASPDYMQDLLNLTPGSVTIMGLMFDPEKKVKLLIDRDVLREEFFGFHPCINTSSLKISTKDLTEKLIPALGHEPVYVDLTED